MMMSALKAKTKIAQNPPRKKATENRIKKNKTNEQNYALYKIDKNPPIFNKVQIKFTRETDSCLKLSNWF